jgi:hypothetical protein
MLGETDIVVQPVNMDRGMRNVVHTALSARQAEIVEMIVSPKRSRRSIRSARTAMWPASRVCLPKPNSDWAMPSARSNSGRSA